MKKLIIVNGTMGVGKTTTCNYLLKLAPKSIFLDGDWCWNMDPFVVNDETKLMVIDNITHLLGNYLKCSEYENIIFCWVIHDESIFEDILKPLKDLNFEVMKISLICSKEALVNRIKKDIQNDIRHSDVIERTIPRLALYEKMDTIKVDVSNISPKEAAIKIYEIIK